MAMYCKIYALRLMQSMTRPPFYIMQPVRIIITSEPTSSTYSIDIFAAHRRLGAWTRDPCKPTEQLSNQTVQKPFQFLYWVYHFLIYSKLSQFNQSEHSKNPWRSIQE